MQSSHIHRSFPAFLNYYIWHSCGTKPIALTAHCELTYESFVTLSMFSTCSSVWGLVIFNFVSTLLPDSLWHKMVKYGYKASHSDWVNISNLYVSLWKPPSSFLHCHCHCNDQWPNKHCSGSCIHQTVFQTSHSLLGIWEFQKVLLLVPRLVLVSVLVMELRDSYLHCNSFCPESLKTILSLISFWWLTGLYMSKNKDPMSMPLIA